MSVGNDVFYVSRGSADGRFPPVKRAAKITEIPNEQINDGSVVSLVVFNPTGLFFDQEVRYSADGEPGSWTI